MRARYCRFRPTPLLVLAFALPLALALGGCGSKITEANYYRVQYGMTEQEVEDLLGPAHSEAVMPPATRPATSQPATTRATVRKVKTWTRDKLTIRVEFEGGVVVGRGAHGIPAEAVSVPPAAKREAR